LRIPTPLCWTVQAHDAPMAVLDFQIGMFGQKLGDIALDRLGQQGPRAIAQDLGQLVGEDPWLNQLKDVIVGHGVSLLQWRSGGFSTPTIRRLFDSRRHQLSAIAPFHTTTVSPSRS
jgi:hypothetical protein